MRFFTMIWQNGLSFCIAKVLCSFVDVLFG